MAYQDDSFNDSDYWENAEDSRDDDIWGDSDAEEEDDFWGDSDAKEEDDFWGGSATEEDDIWGASSSDGEDIFGGTTASDDFWGESENMFAGSSRSQKTKSGKTGRKLPFILAVAAAVLLVLGAISQIGAPEGPGMTMPSGNSRPGQSAQAASDPTLPASTHEQLQAPTQPQQTVPQQTVPQQTIPQQTGEQTGIYPVRYHGQKLSPAYQQVYLKLVEGIAAHEARIPNLIVKEAVDLNQITDAVYWDYGEFFWYNGGYSTTHVQQGSFVNITLCPGYHWDKATSQKNAQYVESVTQDLVARCSGMGDYEKVKAVYEYLIDYTVYDLNYRGTLYDLFYNGRAVCAAYARATQYLLNKLGIEAIYVTGDGYSTATGTWEGHAWNIVKIEGEYYQVDTTWGDPVTKDGEQIKLFTYLCLTTEEISRNHRAQWELYPDCTATTYRYYAQEGRYLTTYDTELIKQWIVEENSKGKTLEFQIADKALYDKVVKNLIKTSKFHDLFRESIGSVGTYYHSENDVFYVIRISW